MDLRLHEERGSVWQKCSRHDLSKHRFLRGGVCPFCLHERLSSLCRDCAHVYLCTPRTSIPASEGDVGSVGRVANLMECEPAFRRSKSMAIPFIGSSKPEPDLDTGTVLQPGRGRLLILRLFRGNKGETKPKAATSMKKSRSVAVSDAGDLSFSPTPVTHKGNGWYFPSPIKIFRQSIVSKMMFQQRSPLYRG